MSKSMIEVPVELIERGDIDALRDLLPQDYFGRWATHPEYGRVLVTTKYPDSAGEIPCATGLMVAGEPNLYYLPVSELEFDLTELVTREDFENAPDGTVIARYGHFCHEKIGESWWARDRRATYEQLERAGVWPIIRWGRGDE